MGAPINVKGTAPAMHQAQGAHDNSRIFNGKGKLLAVGHDLAGKVTRHDDGKGLVRPNEGTDRRRAKDAGKRKEALCQSKEDRFNIAKQARLIKNTGIAGPNHDDARRTSHGKKAPATEHGIELRVRGGKAKEHDMKDSGKGKALIEIRAEET